MSKQNIVLAGWLADGEVKLVEPEQEKYCFWEKNSEDLVAGEHEVRLIRLHEYRRTKQKGKDDMPVFQYHSYTLIEEKK